jgi:tRNA(Ile)-lysidine synthase
VSEEMDVSAPVDPIVDLVRQTLRRHACFAAGETVVVAVSGGADSLCLLHVLSTLHRDLGFHLHVAHLDHSLRGESARADARFVAQLAAELGLSATVEARDVAAYQRLHRLTMEEAARETRYSFLLEVARGAGAAAVATGHTADDDVETLVLHWLRGAGLAGMRGMPIVRELGDSAHGQRGTGGSHVRLPSEAPTMLVRPLLQVTRAQTEAYCREHGLAFRVDETNEDLRVTRNRIRRQLLPELESYNPGLRATLLRSARAAVDDFDYISSQADAAWPGIVAEPQDRAAGLALNRDAFRGLPPALQRSLLRRALQQARQGWQDFGWVHIESLRLAVTQGRVGAVVNLPHGMALTVGYERAVLAPLAEAGARTELTADSPLLLGDALPVNAPGTTPLPGTAWRLDVDEAPLPARLAAGPWEAFVDAGAVAGALILRGPRAGDRFQPLGMTGTKKSQDLFVDEKVPRQYRSRTPLLVAGGRIVWVAGRWLAEWARVRPETRQVWRLRFRRQG